MGKLYFKQNAPKVSMLKIRLVSKKGGVNMSRGLSSMRIERLNMLLGTLRSRDYISRDGIMTECRYTSSRTLESDIRFLREVFGARIRYSRRVMGYILEDAGKYILDGGEK